MAYGTEEKLMEAALKEFAEKGYAGAKTKVIAERSGVSEMTLFRRFKSKRNLFKQVLKKYQEDAIKEYNLILENKKNENSDDYFKQINYRLWETTEKNFDFLSLVILEKEKISEDITSDMISKLSELMALIFPKSNIDPEIIAFSILSFMYLSVLDKHQEREVINHKEDFKKFIKYITTCLIKI